MKLRDLAFASASALLLAGPASAEIYGQGNVGIGVAGDVEFDGTLTGGGVALPYSQSSDLDPGWQVSGSVGVTDFPLPNWRLEGEGLYLNNETDDGDDSIDDSFDLDQDGENEVSSADVDIYGVFANLIYDFNGIGEATGGWTPYAGVGVGWGKVKVEYLDAEADDEVGMYQGKLGVAYELGTNSMVDIGYRYLNAQSADVTDDDINLDVTGEVDTEVHSVTVGYRWMFGGGY